MCFTAGKPCRQLQSKKQYKESLYYVILLCLLVHILEIICHRKVSILLFSASVMFVRKKKSTKLSNMLYSIMTDFTNMLYLAVFLICLRIFIRLKIKMANYFFHLQKKSKDLSLNTVPKYAYNKYILVITMFLIAKECKRRRKIGILYCST